MNYHDTLIEVADDCPTKKALVPYARPRAPGRLMRALIGSVDPEALDEVASESEAIHDVGLAARKVAAQMS
jgi:hypothetical protein